MKNKRGQSPLTRKQIALQVLVGVVVVVVFLQDQQGGAYPLLGIIWLTLRRTLRSSATVTLG